MWCNCKEGLTGEIGCNFRSNNFVTWHDCTFTCVVVLVTTRHGGEKGPGNEKETGRFSYIFCSCSFYSCCRCFWSCGCCCCCCCCCLCCWKGRRKPRAGEGKSEMRGSGSYFPLSALPAFHSFQISHIINRNVFVLKESHCYSFLSSSDLSTVCFAVFNGGQGRTCERYILWSVVMPSTPVYAICMHCTCTHIMFWHYAGYLCPPFLFCTQKYKWC